MEIALGCIAVWLVLSVVASVLFAAICRGGQLEEENWAAWLAENEHPAERAGGAVT